MPGVNHVNIAIYCIILKYRELSFVSLKNSIARGGCEDYLEGRGVVWGEGWTMPGVNHTLDDNIGDNREQRVGEL